MPKALDGIRVLDFTQYEAGPSSTQMLAWLGAEVIKIEPPDGDPTRRIGPADGPSTIYFRNLNRGKKSVMLDLKSEQGRADLFRLACEADVLVESFRPGIAARFGIGYEMDQASAHRSPDKVRDLVRGAPARGVEVFVAKGFGPLTPYVVATVLVAVSTTAMCPALDT